ncbi:MAG: sulfatase [bacterium]
MPWILIWFLASLMVFSASGWSETPSIKRCIFLTLDTCRADRLTCYGSTTSQTPFLDSLAEKGTLFEDAMATAPLTLPSHSSMFTGDLVSHHHVRDNAWYRLKTRKPTLAEQLQQAGVDTAAVIGAFPLENRFGIAQGFAYYDDKFLQEPNKKGDPWYGHRPSRFERPGDEVTDAALKWLKEHGVSGKSFFLWVHYFDPHSPYKPPPPFDGRFPKQPYNGEVESMDHSIGRLLEGVKELGLEEGTLFVAVGDHGESLGEHGMEGHGQDLYEVVLRVPLILRLDGVIGAGRKIPGTVQLTDLYPTVLKYFGQEPLVPVDGVSLWPTLENQEPVPRKPSFAETIYMERMLKKPGEGLFCVRAGPWKLIADHEGKAVELYNLDNDPDEGTNLLEDAESWEKAHAPEMQILLNRYIQETEEESQEAVSELDPETMEAMKSLGYVH